MKTSAIFLIYLQFLTANTAFAAASAANRSGISLLVGQTQKAHVEIKDQSGYFRFRGREGTASLMTELGSGAIRPQFMLQIGGLKLENQAAPAGTREEFIGGNIGGAGRFGPPWILAPFVEAGIGYQFTTIKRVVGSSSDLQYYLAGARAHLLVGITLRLGPLQLFLGEQGTGEMLSAGMNPKNKNDRLRSLTSTRLGYMGGLGLLL